MIDSQQLFNVGSTVTWLPQHVDNDSFIYFNQVDQTWRMDGENDSIISPKPTYL